MYLEKIITINTQYLTHFYKTYLKYIYISENKRLCIFIKIDQIHKKYIGIHYETFQLNSLLL